MKHVINFANLVTHHLLRKYFICYGFTQQFGINY